MHNSPKPRITSSRVSFSRVSDDTRFSIYDFTDRLGSNDKSDLSAQMDKMDENDDSARNEFFGNEISTEFSIHPDAYSEDIKEKFLSGTEVVYTFSEAPQSFNEHNTEVVNVAENMISRARRDEKRIHSSQPLSHMDQLISLAIPVTGYIPTQEFLFSFFLSVRRYMSVNELLSRIVEKIFVIQTSTEVDIGTRSDHILFIISYWITTMPYDFRDMSLLDKLMQLFMLCLKYNPNCYFDVRFITGMLLKELRRLSVYENDRTRRYQPNKSLITTSIADECTSVYVLAEQLYIIEVDHLKHIGAEEYIQYLTINKSSKSHFKKRTFNVEAYVGWVNRLSYFTTTEVVKQLRKRKRVSVIEYFIDVIDCSLKMKNFNSAMALISGLDDRSVRRMKNTWQSLSFTHYTRFNYYQSLLDVSNNFASYRGAFAEASKEQSENACIPFFCVALKDMHYVIEVMPDLVNENMINYEKMYQLASLVAQLNLLSKTIAVKYRRRSYIIELLQTMMIFDSNTSMDASYKCEKESKTDKRLIV